VSLLGSVATGVVQVTLRLTVCLSVLVPIERHNCIVARCCLDRPASSDNTVGLSVVRLSVLLTCSSVQVCTYNRIPLIRTMVIRNSNYPDRLSPYDEHFSSVTVLHLFMA
jgi:hypothetical protein